MTSSIRSRFHAKRRDRSFRTRQLTNHSRRDIAKKSFYEDCDDFFNGSIDDDVVRQYYAGTRRTGKATHSGGSSFARALAQARLETGRNRDPQAARSL